MFFHPKNKRSRMFALAVLSGSLLLALGAGGKDFLFPPARAQSPGVEATVNSSRPGRVMEIDAQALRNLMQMDPNLYLVDVRETEELSGPLGHIKQAAHVPLGQIINNPGQFPENKTLVFICRSGRRSLMAASVVAAEGLTAYSVKGGMRAWNKLPHNKPVSTPPVKIHRNEKHQVPADKNKNHESSPVEEDMGC